MLEKSVYSAAVGYRVYKNQLGQLHQQSYCYILFTYLFLFILVDTKGYLKNLPLWIRIYMFIFIILSIFALHNLRPSSIFVCWQVNHQSVTPLKVIFGFFIQLLLKIYLRRFVVFFYPLEFFNLHRSMLDVF